MPVDPRIFENLKLPTAREPLKMFEDIARLKALESEQQSRQSDAQVRQMQARLAQQKFDTEQQEMQALSEAWQQSGGDPLKAIDRVRSTGHYDLADKMEKHYYDTQTSQANLQAKQDERVRSVFPTVKDQASLSRAKSIVRAINPAYAEQIPDVYDDSTAAIINQLGQIGLSDPERQAITNQEAQRKLQADTLAETKRYHDYQMTKPATSSESDYGRFEADFIAAEALTRNKAITALTPPELVQIKVAARKAYGQADDRPVVRIETGQGSDVAEAVRAMKEGTAPPLLPGRASKEYIAVMAEAHRQNFDLASAATDWVATQKHIATLNGAQQTRLLQAIGQLPDLLDSVDALASKWKAGKFAVLNRANLAAAKNGLYGQQAASIANQLDAQIADVTADLGAVYMGGNSPTDHALELAGKALKSEWDEKTLHDMVTLARQNVQTRLHSIQNVGVQGASPNNPYAPQPPPVDPKDPMGILK